MSKYRRVNRRQTGQYYAYICPCGGRCKRSRLHNDRFICRECNEVLEK